MRGRIFFLCLFVAPWLFAQSPTPIVPQTSPSSPATVTQPTNVASAEATASNVKTLRELKAANEEILKKQKATLETLDELQKAADQIKIFTRRS